MSSQAVAVIFPCALLLCQSCCGLWWNFLVISIHTSTDLSIVYPCSTLTSCEFRHWAIHCQSTTTHVVTFHPLGDTAQIHVGAPCLHNPGGQGLVIDLIIASAASMTIRTRFFPTAQTQKPTLFVPYAWACMQHHQNMGWPASNNGQKIQRQPLLMREWQAKTLRLHQYQAQHQTCLLRMQYCHSQSSWLSSGTESIRLLPLTIQMSGNTCYKRWNSHRNIQMLLVASISVSISVSLQLPLLKLLLITNLSLSFHKNLTKLHKVRYRKDNTLAQSRGKMWKLSLALSSCLPSQSSQNQVEWVNTIIFRTIHFQSPLPLNSPIHQLIYLWIQTLSLWPGAPFWLSLYLFTGFHWAPNCLLDWLQSSFQTFQTWSKPDFEPGVQESGSAEYLNPNLLAGSSSSGGQTWTWGLNLKPK